MAQTFFSRPKPEPSITPTDVNQLIGEKLRALKALADNLPKTPDTQEACDALQRCHDAILDAVESKPEPTTPKAP